MSPQNFRAYGLVLATTFGLCAFSSGVLAQSSLTLDHEGLGGITAATPFDIPALRKTVPNVAWKRDVVVTEGGTQTVFRATRHGKTGYTLYGDGRGRVGAIEIVSPNVGNRFGPRVGDTYRSTRQNGQLGSCRPGSDAQSGSVVCEAAQSGNISYQFSGRWNGPDGEMPPVHILNRWTISHVFWRPDHFANVTEPFGTQDPGPAFDCSKAQGSIEDLICTSPELARLDRLLNTAYADKIASLTPRERRFLRAEQRGWVKGRNACWKSSDPHQCAMDVYNDRITELSAEHKILPGTTWIGVRIAGDAIPDDIDINMTFGTDSKITGSSGCNRFFATYSQDGRNLNIDQIGSTRRMCAELQMLAERRFLDALEHVDGWAMRNEVLVLFGTGAELTFRHQ